MGVVAINSRNMYFNKDRVYECLRQDIACEFTICAELKSVAVVHIYGEYEYRLCHIEHDSKTNSYSVGNDVNVYYSSVSMTKTEWLLLRLEAAKELHEPKKTTKSEVSNRK